MDKKNAIELVKKFAYIAKKYFHVKMIILYGSYARENYRADSDIDVAVVVDKIDDDILSAEKLLFKLRREVDSRIEPILLEKNNDPADFLSEILKYGIIIG